MRILYEYILEELDVRAVNARSGVYCSYIQKIKGNRKTVLFAEDIGGMSCGERESVKANQKEI